MNTDQMFAPLSPLPTVVGAGTVTLDINTIGPRNEAPFLCAGGPCGNVVTILAWLGWHAVPAARIGGDRWGNLLRADMERWGVDTRFLTVPEEKNTPMIVVQADARGDGSPAHRFSWTCPRCGRKVPRFSVLSARNAEKILATGIRPEVFYCDRASSAAVRLAEAYRAAGALIVYEPQWLLGKRYLPQMMALADIVKVSGETTRGGIRNLAFGTIPLFIETLGAAGLRYRLAPESGGTGDWIRVPGFAIDNVRDTVGAGDWCTAGLLHALHVTGGFSADCTSDKTVQEALRFGQALGALNSRYYGARGMMDALTRDSVKACVRSLNLEGDDHCGCCPADPVRPAAYSGPLCPGCDREDTPVG